MAKQEKSSSPRVARRRAQMRERILTTATRLFAERGIDNVTLTDITNESDVSRGNFYSHFTSKEELVQAICLPVMEYGLDQMKGLIDPSPAQAIEGLLRGHAEIWRKFPGAALVMYQLQEKIGAHSEASDAVDDHTLGKIFHRAAELNLLRMEPILAVKLVKTIVVPLLSLAQEAEDPDAFFVESMLRLLLKRDGEAGI